MTPICTVLTGAAICAAAIGTGINMNADHFQFGLIFLILLLKIMRDLFHEMENEK